MKKIYLFIALLLGCATQEVAAQQAATTIDSKLQVAVDSILMGELDLIDGSQGQAIVMEVQTGEILAMAGLERNFEGKFQPCKNFAYQQELGAVTNVASLLTCLETGKVKLSDVVDTEKGVWKFDKETVIKDHNWFEGGYGKITLDRAIEVSSNIGVSKTVWNTFKGNEQQFYDLLNKMSFGKPDNIEGVSGLKPAFICSPKDSDWVDKDLLWSSIGFNQKIAPIQMLTFYNAIANNGRMVKPRLTKGQTEVINDQIASLDNVRKMQTVLDHVVSQGLGKKAGNPMLKVAGKIGTSQVKEYQEGDNTIFEYQMAFCGYFPAEAPKYSIIVSLNKLGLPASGGAMAGVVFHDIVEWMIAHEIRKM